uniref:Uncharacterized protein n=1 Tax=Anopheles culicifacies TaxID=139723 RepID=A0A182MMQ0_9DIPT
MSKGARNEWCSNQPSFVRPVTTDIQLVRADLVKTWDDASKATPPQMASLKLAPVSRTVLQQTATPQPKYPAYHQTPHNVLKQGSILPPTGVLPPSSLTRTVSIGGTKKYNEPSAHRFAPVRTVLPIQKVTVVPANSYQPQSNFQTRLGNFQPTFRTTPAVEADSFPVQTLNARSEVNFPYKVQPQTYAPVERSSYRYTNSQQVPAAYIPPVSHTPSQLLRRSDVGSSIPNSRRFKTTTVLQVVPSLSFYLNDAAEKRAFDEAVRQGLFDERRRRAYTSYDVPLGSVGRLGSTAYFTN